MKKFVFGIVLAAVTTMFQVYAMKQDPGKYKLTHVIEPVIKLTPITKERSPITFVKKISNNEIIFFDDLGRGEIYDLKMARRYPQIISISPDDCRFLEDVFMYTDRGGEKLLVFYIKNRSLLVKFFHESILRTSLYAVDTLQFNFLFSVHQRSDGSLLLQNCESHFVSKIDPYLVRNKNFEIRDLVYCDTTQADCLDSDFKQEETIISHYNYNYNMRDKVNHGAWEFSFEALAIEDLSDEQQKSIKAIGGRGFFWNSLEPLLFPKCYHKTSDGFLICGHFGFLTIWKKKE